MCEILSNIPKLDRIRYLTSHPIDIDNTLIKTHKNNRKLMPFLHLPIQSGSDKILQCMNRNHSRKFYIDLTSKIKSEVKDIAFSSDFIVGYPGETDQDFQDTLDVIEKVKFASSYSFIYSKRPGTTASIKKKAVDESKAMKRLEKIQKLLNSQQKKFNESFIDNTVEILITGRGKKNNQFVGRTPHLQPVHIFSKYNVIGEMMKVKIKNLTSFSFHGELIG